MNTTEDYPLRVQRYWHVVAVCLTRFHQYEPEKAEFAVKAFRDAMALKMTDPELVYHEEPFYIACDISDMELPLPRYREEYDKVLKEART